MKDGSADLDRVIEIPFSELYAFPNHPFKVLDDESMTELAKSIQERGVLVPAIVRPRKEGGYEIVAGHRRRRGCELAGKDRLPSIVRDLDDDAAIIVMVDINIQREGLLPSERAYAYRMKLEAMKPQGHAGIAYRHHHDNWHFEDSFGFKELPGFFDTPVQEKKTAEKQPRQAPNKGTQRQERT